jgi:cytidine deaminase
MENTNCPVSEEYIDGTKDTSSITDKFTSENMVGAAYNKDSGVCYSGASNEKVNYDSESCEDMTEE